MQIFLFPKWDDKREQEKLLWPSRTKALWAGLSQGVKNITGTHLWLPPRQAIPTWHWTWEKAWSCPLSVSYMARDPLGVARAHRILAPGNKAARCWCGCNVYTWSQTFHSPCNQTPWEALTFSSCSYNHLFLLHSHSRVESNHHRSQSRTRSKAFWQHCGGFRYYKWAVAAFVLRDPFLLASTCHRQTNKTDALGTRSPWVHCGIQLCLSRISDKLQWAWLITQVVSHPKGKGQTKITMFPSYTKS